MGISSLLESGTHYSHVNDIPGFDTGLRMNVRAKKSKVRAAGVARNLLRRADMHKSIELAGFAAAQIVCCLFDNQPIVPLAFSRRASNTKAVTIISGGNPEEIAAQAEQWLESNVDAADEAVVAVDGYVTIPAGRKDAVILDLRSYRSPEGQMRMAVPYRPHHDAAGFAIYRPKFIVARLDQHDMDAWTEAFFRGVFSHQLGGQIWKAWADGSW